MTSGRQGEHPARAYGVTGGGFAEGQANPDECEQDKRVEGFATGQDDPGSFPEDEQLGSFSRGQEEQTARRMLKRVHLAPSTRQRNSPLATTPARERIS